MNMNLARYDDTIAAPATIPGTGAITVIRLSGGSTFDILDKVVTFSHGSASEALPNTIKYGNILNSDGSVLDEVLVSIFKAPHSYTGEDSAEISCHASSYIASEILRLLCDAGARPAEAGEFTRRAFINGKMDLSQAEAVADVISANSSASLHLAMSQLRGNYSSKLNVLHDKLLEMSSLLELELDFSEEDVEFADRGKLSSLLEDVLAHIQMLKDSFKYGNEIKNGVPVAIAGRVNSGKSTLLNAISGEERAIVTDIPGTTRDTLEESVRIGSVQLCLTDTAGIRDTEDRVEKIGIERAKAAVDQSELVLYLIDSSEGITREDRDIALFLKQWKKDIPSVRRCIILLNKSDLPPVTDVDSVHSFFTDADAVLSCSLRTGEGADELGRKIEEMYRAGELQQQNEVMLTSSRHREAVREACGSLSLVRQSIAMGMSEDFFASLGRITGDAVEDDLVEEIFSKFCMGK